MKYKEILVPVRIAKKLRKIGFDKKCHFFWNFYDDVYDLCCYADMSEDSDDYLLPNAYNYNNENSTGYYAYLSMPTYEQVFAWFREKGIESYIARYNGGFYKFIISVNDGEDYYFDSSVDVEYGSYEYARLKCIDELIEAYEEVREEQMKILKSWD